MKRYLINLLTWLDVGINVAFCAGNPHETISDRAALARAKGRRWGCVMCGLLEWVNPGHCDRALRVLEVPMIEEFPDL